MMDKKENVTKEEAVKSVMFTFAILHYQGETVRKVLLSSIGYLRRQYEQTGNPHFMNLAEIELLAYISMGFSLPADEDVRYIMEKNDIQEGVQNCRFGKRVRLNRTQVRSLIGKWMPSKYTPMTIGQVVDDIIEKVSAQEAGTWRYTYHRLQGGTVHREEYELVITPEETFFWDLNNFRFYTFETNRGKGYK